MAWQVGDLGDCFEDWALGKTHQERVRLLEGLLKFADQPLTELPGEQVPGRSPMVRCTVIDSTLQPVSVSIRVFVSIHVYESQGVLDVTELIDF